MRNIKTIILSPILLSLVPFIVIILAIPVKSQRYELDVMSLTNIPNDHYIFYNDLTGDGISEKIVATDQDNSAGISIYNEKGIIDQWNFRGSFGINLRNNLFISGDKEGNGLKELYVFTTSADTIFLHCISDLNNSALSISNRVLAIAGPGIKNPDPFIIPAEMEDLNDDGVKELIFGIGSGFSYSPRNIYAYYISNDSLVSSPASSYFIHTIIQADITGDGKREIIPYGYSAGNISPEKAKYHDFSSFLIVLDQNLKFLFNPVEFKGKFSQMTPIIKRDQARNSLSVLFTPPSQLSNSTIYNIDHRGNITDSIPLGAYSYCCSNFSISKNEEIYLLYLLNKGFGIADQNFKIGSVHPVELPGEILRMDIDNDDLDEILITTPQKSKILIFRDLLTYPVSFNIPFTNSGHDVISLKLNGSSHPELSIQAGLNHYLIRYRQNPAYPWFYGYYLAIYLGILGFALAMKNIQKNQLKKRYENEKKISELQLALIRNQLDPHFTLNAINSIIYSVNNSDKEQATERLRCFSELYRDLILSAGSSRRKVAEEVAFCRNYLMLEKMRFGKKFDFYFEISEDVNQNALIPRLIIQIHAENAIKHGLAPLKSGGILNISLRNDGYDLIIEVTDNGVGREQALKEKIESTGKGLEIMSELYRIYNKYYNETISSQIIDLFDASGVPSGTSVVIRIKRKQAEILAAETSILQLPLN